MTSRKQLVCLLLLSLLCYSVSSQETEEAHDHEGHEHEPCRHDEVEQNIEDLDIEEDMTSLEEGRVLADSSYPPLRIYPYLDYLGTSSFDTYVKNELATPIVSYFAAALRVKYPISGKLKLGSSVSRICDRAPPSILKTTGVDADLFIYFDTYSTQQFVAYASACYKASGTNRPIIAQTMVNSVRMENGRGNVLVHERNLYTIMHETMHALGFDSYQFNNFLDTNGKRRTGHVKSVQIAGKTRTVLDLPPLTQRLRDHYGCSTLQGAIMENDGGSGTAKSHFETKYFLWDIMVSSSNYGRRVSEFTLAVLEGTGWYVPNYEYAEPFFFGQGQGCSFLSSTCSGTPKFDEYCTGSNRGCTLYGRGGGSCVTSSLLENCKAYRQVDQYDCDNDSGSRYASRLSSLQVFGRGSESKCFTGTLNTKSAGSSTSFCFKYTCVGSGSSTKLNVQVGSNTITCTGEGKQTVSGYAGAIDCPDPLTFCNTVGKKYCPLNCAGRGTCVSGKCRCNSGFSGIDCTLKA